MRASMHDLTVAVDVEQGTIRSVEWGGMNVELGSFHAEVDPAPLFAGLPDDRCQCPHWGYVIAGELRYRYADREEIYRAGDIYYAPPGHLPVLGAGCTYIEFSPLHEYRETMEIIEMNMETMQATAS